MKKLILIASLCFTFTLSAFAQWENNSPTDSEVQRILRTNPRLMKFFLEKSLIPRCTKYAKLTVNQCAQGLNTMVSKIDFDVKFIMDDQWKMEHFIFAAFKKELLTLLDSENTLRYLEALKDQVDGILPRQSEDFNLWNFTLRFFKNDRAKTLQMIAVLFQDTSVATMHLAFIESMNLKRSNVFDINMDRLRHILFQISSLEDYIPAKFQKYFYPPEIKAKMNAGFYHFYVMGYLANSLNNKYSASTSKALPLVLSVTYEFVSTHKSARYVLEEPKTYTQKDHFYSHRDMYAAYLGVNFALGNKSVGLTQGQLGRSFDSSVSRGITELFK